MLRFRSVRYIGFLGQAGHAASARCDANPCFRCGKAKEKKKRAKRKRPDLGSRPRKRQTTYHRSPKRPNPTQGLAAGGFLWSGRRPVSQAIEYRKKCE